MLGEQYMLSIRLSPRWKVPLSAVSGLHVAIVSMRLHALARVEMSLVSLFASLLASNARIML